ncbi:MAG: 23S rRNA (adenine(2503)-C(2))-methyltransferase RlmN [Geminicoccaceae bacterium]|nr:MAG: 23S rRNA (adenine(2503)-C(2))-methyltransferase RlmN [Geminicoccaceae bacterium]
MSGPVGLDRANLAEHLATAGVPERQLRMRTNQLWGWLYRRGAASYDAMSDLPAGLRRALAERLPWQRPTVSEQQVSSDGTIKWLIRMHDGREVEAVYIPEPDRGALCISSQVGCTLSCTFCHTGTMQLVRNLAAGEIVEQLRIARDTLGDWDDGQPRRLTNIVVMGMGEPLFNYDNVRAALRIAMDGEGIGISRRRITLSTSGVVPRIGEVGHDLRTKLAISLHAVTDELRDVLVPVNKKWNIAELLAACRAYPHDGRPITFEYVMLDQINDSDAEARELVRLLQGFPAKVNLIPFNPWPGTNYGCSPWKRIDAFARILEDAGYASPVRRPRGRDILAACGQLKTQSERARRERVANAA